MNLSPLKFTDLPKNLIGFSMLFVTISIARPVSLKLIRIKFLTRLRQCKSWSRKLANIKATVLMVPKDFSTASDWDEYWKRIDTSYIGLGGKHRHFHRSFADTPDNIRLLSEMVQDNNIHTYCSTIGVDMEVFAATFDLNARKLLSNLLDVDMTPKIH